MKKDVDNKVNNEDRERFFNRASRGAKILRVYYGIISVFFVFAVIVFFLMYIQKVPSSLERVVEEYRKISTSEGIYTLISGCVALFYFYFAGKLAKAFQKHINPDIKLLYGAAAFEVLIFIQNLYKLFFGAGMELSSFAMSTVFRVLIIYLVVDIHLTVKKITMS